MFTKISKKIFQHKFITAIFLGLLVLGFYFGKKAINGDNEKTKYVLAAAEKGVIISSVSGSGQIIVADRIDIKPKVSGDITAIYVTKDQSVKAGQLIAVLDATDEERSVRDAQTALDKVRRDLEDAKENYQEIGTDAKDSLETVYEDGYSSVSSSFFKLSDYMKDLKDVLGTESGADDYIAGYELVLGKDSIFIQRLLEDYDKANDLFTENFTFFRTVFQDDARENIYKLINDTIDTTKAISQALESARHLYDEAVINENYKKITIASQIDKMQPKIESDVSSVYSSITSIQQIKDNIDETNKNTPKNVEDAKLAIESAQNIVVQKEEALSDAKKKLNEYNIRAPFSGVIASVSDQVKIGDSVSSGTVLATLITKQKLAEISLNEIDAAKVKVGQKVTLTFDALTDISLTGKVAEIDTVGTASQGVVSYGVKITLDSGVDLIKAGYSVTADIIIDAKQDVLVLPNGAIKSDGDSYYVELVDAEENSQFTKQLLASVGGTILPKLPNRQWVEIGLSSDTSTEIVSGLKEGDMVVISTISQSQNQISSQTSKNQGFQMSGMSSERVIMR